MLGSIIKSLYHLICGSSTNEQETKPQQQHQAAQHERPPKQEQWHQQQQQQHRPHEQRPPRQEYPPQQQHRPQEQRPEHQEAPHHGGKRTRRTLCLPPYVLLQDPNLVNQSDPYYLDLRARANKEGDAMARAFDESHKAYTSGNGARAKELSNEGKAHQRQMEEFNKKAADWIFDSKPGEVDLHGLYVKEAVERTEIAIEDAKRRGDREIHLIVGKGLHSNGKAAKIKPAIEQLMAKHNLAADLDPDNAGVLIVQIGGGDHHGVDPDEITRRLDRGGESCLIM
ncbi:hypothetical protein EV715DRAFT_209969 [Schizophyllum commune]